jgi:hypothetical protein
MTAPKKPSVSVSGENKVMNMAGENNRRIEAISGIANDASAWAFRNECTTASFSSGSSEQVE